MSLSFLTADSSSQEQVGGAPPRRPAQNHWARPYRPGPHRVAGAALLLMFASALLFATLFIALAGAGTTAGIIVGVAALLIAWALRLLRVGIWVSDAGLRQVSLVRTRTVPWHRVASIRTSQQPVRYLGLPRTVQGQALLITLTGGETLPYLLTDHSPDFLAHAEAFDIAADTLESWAADRGTDRAAAARPGHPGY